MKGRSRLAAAEERGARRVGGPPDALQPNVAPELLAEGRVGLPGFAR